MTNTASKKQIKPSTNTWNAVPSYLFQHLRPRPQDSRTGIRKKRKTMARSLFHDEPKDTASCKTAAGLLAYLHDLLEYTQGHLQDGNANMSLEGLTNRLHQPFGALQRDCATQSREVRQIQLCIEVLRSYLGNRPLADAEQEASLAAAEAAYLEAAYRSLLLYLGASYEEMEQAAAADEVTRSALAQRLGIEVDFLNRFWTAAAALSEDWLEQQFGLPNTSGAILSEGVKSNDGSNQIKQWFFTGLAWKQTTDEWGKLYLSLRRDANEFVLEVYQDEARTNLLASGSSNQSEGTIELTAVDESGLSGSVDIAYVSDADDLVISIFPDFLACRLQKVHERWQALEEPDSPEGLQFLEEQEQAARTAVAEAVKKTTAAYLPDLRRGLIQATGLPARRLSEQLMIGCEYDVVFQTTRVWQAITSLQQLILSVRSGLLLDTHPDLKLNTPDFEEEWQWLGSYESWRSAMMVFLYPENLLSPGLRREQTPMLRNIAEELRKKRGLTAGEANVIADSYTRYFKDICQLDVQASCHTIKAGFYQYAMANGSVYQATYGKPNETGWMQSPWEKVPGFDEYNVYQILGAVPYKNSEGKRHIYLFTLARRNQPVMHVQGGDFLLFNRYDLETEVWEWEEKAELLQSFQVAPAIFAEQRPDDIRAPRLLFHYGGTGLKLRVLNREGTGWRNETAADIDPKEGDIKAVHAITYVGGKNRLFVKFADNNIRMGTVIPEDQITADPEGPDTNPLPSPPDPVNPEEDHDFLQLVINEYTPTGAGNFMGVFVDSPETVWQFYQIKGEPGYRLIRISDQNTIEVHPQKTGPAGLSGIAIHSGLQEERVPGTGPLPGNDLNFGFRMAYQNTGEQTGQFHALMERTGADGLEWHSPNQIAPKDINFFNLGPDKNVSTQARKQAIAAALENNRDAPVYTLNYLWEAWYFLPMIKASQLQRSRQYRAAKDWFRLVYDYSLPITDRKIFYGLVQEEDHPSAGEPVAGWLADPLNPHAIAAGRVNAYSRYTLYSLIQCFLQEADEAFTRDTAESLSTARSLYTLVLELLDAPELEQETLSIGEGWELPANPLTALLHFHAEINLYKIHTSRNIAGDIRDMQVLTAEPDLSFDLLNNGYGRGAVLSPAVNLRPTPFRYAVLIERAKYLAGMAQQMEASFLATLEKLDAERLNLLNVKNDLEMSKAGVRLQDLRVRESRNAVKLTELQYKRVEIQRNYFQQLLSQGLLQTEKDALGGAQIAKGMKYVSDVVGFMTSLASPNPLDTFSSLFSLGSSLFGASPEDRAINELEASYERRSQEWAFQHNLANQDIQISSQQLATSKDQLQIVQQESGMATLRSNHAREVADFLLTKFTNAELYEWMSDILEGIYSFFLQQATATAQLAAQQLAFERQEPVPAVILSDYWEAPNDDQLAASDTNGNDTGRRGLTGSARLLKDLNQLDQIAFQTDRRKLQMSKTISLAQLSPAEFQQFRETGSLPFHTSMELFDRDFPGHYLRLIKRVRVSVIALTPPTEGIKATLVNNGISRVVLSNGFSFETTEVLRSPESIAFTSPLNATGLFELQADDGKLLPFESTGVDTFWELQLPKAANFFDYSSIADVLLTIEYTALSSPDYRRQVIERLDRRISADRAFSFRQEFPDQWYDFHHPELTDTPMTITFDTRRADFPANLEDLRIKHVVLYFSRKEGEDFEVNVRYLRFTPQNSDQALGNANQDLSSVEGILSTRSGSIEAWDPIISGDQAPVGNWELSLPNQEEVLEQFRSEAIEDVLFVITFEARTPSWLH